MYSTHATAQAITNWQLQLMHAFADRRHAPTRSNGSVAGQNPHSDDDTVRGPTVDNHSYTGTARSILFVMVEDFDDHVPRRHLVVSTAVGFIGFI